MKRLIFLILLIPLLITGCHNPGGEWVRLGEDDAKYVLGCYSHDSVIYQTECARNLISDEEIAIKVAEPVLFRIYGKENILDERPYQIRRTGDYWVITGTLVCFGCSGGVFEMIMSVKDGRILYVMHGK